MKKSRYRVVGVFAIDEVIGEHAVMVADAFDTRTGDTFREGAWCVSTVKNGRKGSRTVPFFGESAWMDAQRLAMDLAMDDQYA